jgi:signal transduction histidine kinase
MRKLKNIRIYQLFSLMIVGLLIITITSIFIIHKTVYNEKKSLLHEVCMNQKGIIQSIYGESYNVNIVLDVLEHQRKISEGLGTTGEFTLGFRRNDSIVYLIKSRQNAGFMKSSIPFNSDRGQPMQYALGNHSDFVKGLDYQGNMVLSYVTYIPELKWGLVTKMDIAEVRLPFYQTGFIALISSIILILIATILFMRISRSVVEKIAVSEENYRLLFESSVIPIWKEDYSEVKKYVDQLKRSGVTDLRAYFSDHENEINYVMSLIKVIEINQQSVVFFKAESKAQIIENRHNFYTESFLEVCKEGMMLMADGILEFVREIQIKIMTGETKFLILHLSVVKGYENSLSNVLISFIDITESKRYETELADKNLELEKSNATKDRFFSIIAHDMKNPFISLMGASDLLIENAHKYDKQKVIELAKVVSDSAKSGYNTLLNLLGWASSQAGSLIFMPEQINLKSLIDNNLANITETAFNKQIKLTYSIDDTTKLFADINMLNAILRNLINNAIKFTPRGGEITVGTNTIDNLLVIFIKDNGVGIDKTDLDNLFRPDVNRSRPGTEYETGTGLGLLLCKEFVERHGGEIWVESEKNKGSTFYFNIPNFEF